MLEELIIQAKRVSALNLKRALYLEFYADVDSSKEWSEVFKLRFAIDAYEADPDVANNPCYVSLIEGLDVYDEPSGSQQVIIQPDSPCDLEANLEILTAGTENTFIGFEAGIVI